MLLLRLVKKRMALPDRTAVSKREFLRSVVAAGGMASLAACLEEVDDDQRAVPTGDPENRPQRQHAWNEVLSVTDDGHIQPPEHHVLVPLSLEATPTDDDQAQVETALQSLERAYAYDPDGLLFTVGYAPAYFEQVGAASPIPQPTALTERETPDIDSFEALIHLASNDPAVVLEAEEALFGEVAEPNDVAMEATLSGVFERSEPRRTGFVGEGLPAQFAEEIGGVPDEMPDNAPFFMGFKSGFPNSQAPEDRVTIQDGPYEGGTTTHVESLDIQLQTWFEQDDHFLRVAQMFSPEHAKNERVPGYGDELGSTTDIEQYADQTADDARSEGIVGHAQKAARERDADGTPPLLRRDFNTIDNDFPGLHFLSHQRTIDDFVRVREAMAGEDIAGSGVGQTHNNGILQYIFVNRRGNFLVPPREKRALPVL